MKKSTQKYLLYGVGAYVLLTSGVIGASKVQSRAERRTRQNFDDLEAARQEIERLRDFTTKQDRAFQNYLTYLEGRLNNFPYNLSESPRGPVKIAKGKSGHPGFPFYITANVEDGLVGDETHIDRWASGISWTY